MARIRAPGSVPESTLRYFRQKGYKVGFDYRDVWREEHAIAFTVAKATELAILQSIRQSVDRALEKGWTFRQFQQELTPILQTEGWWGRKDAIDPLTGEKETVQLGSPRRLRTIFNTNVRTARAAGQWQRAQRVKKTHPYFVYRLGPSRDHRDQHESWNGVMLPVDHPWWSVHYPPNGWGCKCHIRQITQKEADRLRENGNVRTRAPRTTKRDWVNKRTGEVEQVPLGIDPGWDYNPGQSQWAGVLTDMEGLLNQAPRDVAKNTVRQLMTEGDAFSLWTQHPGGHYPVAVISENVQNRLQSEAQTVVLSPATWQKQQRAHPELAPAEYQVVQRSLDEGERIQDGERSMIFILEEQDGSVSVVKSTRTGKAVFLTSFRRLSRDEAKRNEEIRRLRSKGN